MLNYLLFILLLVQAIPAYAIPQVLKIPKPQADSLAAQSYYSQLLRLALTKGSSGRNVPELLETGFMTQGRATYELSRGELIDIYWMGTSIDREKQLRAIRIPLDRGLIGYRRFIIRSDREAEFDLVRNRSDLNRLLACQGLDWPDSDIMLAAGLRVIEVAALEGLYQKVMANRCDYFPRGYYEAAPELAQRRTIYPELKEYQPLVLHYPFAVYFFVSRDNEELALWIEQGLEKMIDEGEFLAFMSAHPLTSHIFPLNKAATPPRTIYIPNPLLPADTDYSNSRYWFQPIDFFYDP